MSRTATSLAAMVLAAAVVLIGLVAVLGPIAIPIAFGVALAIAFWAIRSKGRPRALKERREDADRHDARHILALALEAVEEPWVVEQLLERDRASAAPAGENAAGHSEEVLVVSPALNTTLAHWATDVGEAREEAARRLAVSLGQLAAFDVEAEGHVGAADPVQAVEDAMRTYAADAVVVVGEGEDAESVHAKVAERLGEVVAVELVRLDGGRAGAKGL